VFASVGAHGQHFIKLPWFQNVHETAVELLRGNDCQSAIRQRFIEFPWADNVRAAAIELNHGYRSDDGSHRCARASLHQIPVDQNVHVAAVELQMGCVAMLSFVGRRAALHQIAVGGRRRRHRPLPRQESWRSVEAKHLT
jgi:hypothetical protein